MSDESKALELLAACVAPRHGAATLTGGLLDVGDALRETLRSPNELDQNYEAANVVDGLFEIARALRLVAEAIAGKDGAA